MTSREVSSAGKHVSLIKPLYNGIVDMILNGEESHDPNDVEADFPEYIFFYKQLTDSVTVINSLVKSIKPIDIDEINTKFHTKFTTTSIKMYEIMSYVSDKFKKIKNKPINIVHLYDFGFVLATDYAMKKYVKYDRNWYLTQPFNVYYSCLKEHVLHGSDCDAKLNSMANVNTFIQEFKSKLGSVNIITLELLDDSELIGAALIAINTLKSDGILVVHTKFTGSCANISVFYVLTRLFHKIEFKYSEFPSNIADMFIICYGPVGLNKPKYEDQLANLLAYIKSTSDVSIISKANLDIKFVNELLEFNHSVIESLTGTSEILDLSKESEKEKDEESEKEAFNLSRWLDKIGLVKKTD